MSRFRDRIQAGQLLADKLISLKNSPDTIVLALPRGGVPIGYEISQQLKIPLDVFLVRKLGTPGDDELAMGAIAMGGVCIFNDEVVKSFGISQNDINYVIAREKNELERRNQLYRKGKPFPDLKNKIIILVDDGIATGATIRAAINALKQLHSKQIIIATPVCSYDTCLQLKQHVDDMVVLEAPTNLVSISQWYQEFPQVSDDEVCELLNNSQ